MIPNWAPDLSESPRGKWRPRVNFGLGVCLTAASQDQKKGTFAMAKKETEKKEKRIGLKQKHDA